MHTHCRPLPLTQEVKPRLRDRREHPTSELLGPLAVFRRHHCFFSKDCCAMAAHGTFLTLTICVLLGHQTFAKNDAPCQRSKWNNGYDTFIRRHIPPGTPSSLDQNEWEKYIRSKTGCSRPTQSFLSPKDLDRVRDVCTSKGGKAYRENLCISRQPFNFVTVRSEPGTCGIRSIREETKYLILACEVLGNDCLPVHFEGNPENLGPSNNAKGCQDPQDKGHASSLKMTWLWLLSVLLVVFYWY